MSISGAYRSLLLKKPEEYIIMLLVIKMERKPINVTETGTPSEFSSLLQGAKVFDSSCSPEARVYYIEKDGGYFLKKAAKGGLETEALMTAYFHKKGLGAEVLGYISRESDWLLTKRVSGEDCIDKRYLAQPERLCDILAQELRRLHETDFSDCPVKNRNESYIALAEKNYREGNYDSSLFPDNWGYASAQEAFKVVSETKGLLKSDVLLHGDYCLPNIILEDWRFSGFIDLGNGGVGDRHIDLFWGVWTLFFNLKTEKYGERFLDAYGRDKVNPEMLSAVAAFEVFG